MLNDDDDDDDDDDEDDIYAGDTSLSAIAVDNVASPTIDLTDDTPVKRRAKVVDLTEDGDGARDSSKENNNVSRHFTSSTGGHYKHKKAKKQILSGKDLEAYEKSQAWNSNGGDGVDSDGLPGVGAGNDDDDDESR